MDFRTQVTALMVLAFLLISGCGGSRENDPASLTEGGLQKALELIVDETIIPANLAMAEHNQQLLDQIDLTCATPTETTLSELQRLWIDLAVLWHQLLPFNFGPLNNDLIFPRYIFIDSYRSRGIDYSATVRTEIDRLMSLDEVSREDLSASSSRVGLLALEVAIFEAADSDSPDQVDRLNELALQPQKCQLLSAYAQALLENTAPLQPEWLASYRTEFLSGETADGTESITLLMTSVQEYLDYLNNRNVVGNSAQLAAVSWSQMAAAIDTIETLLQGTATTAVSLFDLMGAGGFSAEVATVQANLQLARAAIEDQDAATFNAAAAALDGNFKREIPDSLDVNLGINFSDGD